MILVVGLLSSSCSMYQRDFRKAVAAGGWSESDPSGPWKGKWHSEPSGHEGPLWCLIAEQEGKPGVFDFRYRAGWGVMQFGDYTHEDAGRQVGDEVVVKGEMDLSKAVGVYQVDGTVKAGEFKARFESNRGDRGTMVLRRPAADDLE